MKQLVLYLFITLFVSCDSIIPENETSNFEQSISTKSTLPYYDIVEDLKNIERYHFFSYTGFTDRQNCVHRYYNYANNSHYWGEAPESNQLQEYPTDGSISKNINGVSYRYEGMDFIAIWGDRSLYRLYNPTTKDYKLDISSSVPGFQNPESLGAINSTQLWGTVALLEYYNSVTKRYHYVTRQNEIEWLAQREPNFKYVRTLGYISEGYISDSTLPQGRAKFTFVDNNRSGKVVSSFVLRVHIFDKTTNKNSLILYEMVWNIIPAEVKIPRNCIVTSVDLAVNHPSVNHSEVDYYTDIFRSGFSQKFEGATLMGKYYHYYVNLRKYSDTDYQIIID